MRQYKWYSIIDLKINVHVKFKMHRGIAQSPQNPRNVEEHLDIQ